ncbi:hypothetical protein JTB14_013222 [Gonioctena quinquepunctata]|nr:hypothetical protein JTB14_013222 [Gonioctena quinquepunctata]
MTQWFWLVVVSLVVRNTGSTIWDGITPWYTGSKCNCNGFSNRCYFDEKLYEQTGHGGHCLDCSANRDGPTCATCRINYYMIEDGHCVPCDCDPTGSRSLQCNAEGKCQCNPGVIGEKCSRCDANFHDFSQYGCKSCGCSELGSLDNEPRCDAYSGSCYCKENVEGKRCLECKPGYFNLDAGNKFGCTPCFCFGHSSNCKSAHGFFKYSIESSFSRSDEKWTAEDQFGRKFNLKYDSFTHSVGVKALGDEIIYFVAPQRFLGDQRASYNQMLEFTLRIADNRAIPTATDIILEGSGIAIMNTIFSQQNRVPTIQNQKFSFRLHEHPDYGWQPRLTPRAFMSLLTNLTDIKIKGIYNVRGEGFLDEVKLETASRGVAGEPALWVESCDCPTGYVGQFCESCAPGFRHSPAEGGSFMSCIPCDCNNHASICDSETGICICQHNTAGKNCELCARGYYGNALAGTPRDCSSCGCPNGGACIQVEEEVTMCTECPLGYGGSRCDSCSDGFFGDPKGRLGPPTPCQPCECNRNIDPNAIGNCNTTTGECLRCIHNTGGRKCEVCLPGFYGNALVLPKGDCKICECYALGTEEDSTGAPLCDQTTGACLCKTHVVGRNCDKCENGHFNLHSGRGCQTCNCDPIGSLNQTCDIHSGQCYCRPHVTGPRCDHCEYKKYDFSTTGCKDCRCDEIGSKNLQCDASGQCPCLENVEGEKCDKCKGNKYDRSQGCIDCPDCYNLVQNAANSHNDKLRRLEEILDEIENRPTVIADEEFPNELEKVRREVHQFYSEVQTTSGNDRLAQKVRNVEEREKDISRTLSVVEETIFRAETKHELVENNLEHVDDIFEESSEKIMEIENDLRNNAETALIAAWQRAELAGQQSEKMTRIAHESRGLAERVNSKADDVIAVAKDAKNKSIIAYNNAKDAVAQQTKLSDGISQLKHDLQSTEQKLKKSKDWTKEVTDRTTVVKENALALLSEVDNLVIPQVNIPELRKRYVELKIETSRLSEETVRLFEDSDGLRRKVDEQNGIGRELLRNAKDHHEELVDLKNELVFYESQADGATNLWNEIVQGAETNFKLLTEFDTETQRNKGEAEAALQKVSDIESIIKYILNKTKATEVDMEEAKKNADLALQKAQQADELAGNASLKADQIKLEAEILFKNTTALGEESGLMFDRVQNTEGELKNLLDKFRSNTSLVNDAKEKVGRAGKDTDDVSKKVSTLLLDIEGIMSELLNSPTLQESDVDRLEEEIKMAEEKLREARLEEKLENLQEEHRSQTDLISQYKVQIAMMQEEVENIEEIIETLPEGCFKRVELEP